MKESPCAFCLNTLDKFSEIRTLHVKYQPSYKELNLVKISLKS